jgi:hypothetical protein
MVRAPPGGQAREEVDATATSAGRYDSFVVRVFSPHGGGRRQGQVTHLGTNHTLRFTDLRRILSFILAHVNRSDQ